MVGWDAATGLVLPMAITRAMEMMTMPSTTARIYSHLCGVAREWELHATGDDDSMNMNMVDERKNNERDQQV